MNKTFPAVLLIAALALTGCSKTGSNTHNNDGQNSAQSQEQSNNAETIDLSGVWTHSNSKNGEPGLEARIQGDVIEVKWLLEETLGNGVYWVGTFNSEVPKGDKTTFTSEVDKVAIAAELMSSSDDTKDFTYEDGKLTFPLKFEDQVTTVEMKKTGDLQQGEKVESPGSQTSFKDGVYASPRMTITITESRVIQPGDSGNEYGESPIMVFYFDITNNSNETITPSDWHLVFTAVQDNDPNMINKLKGFAITDPVLMNNSLSEIKPGGTISSAEAYELSDLTTPVDLIASTMLDDEIGRQTFEVN